MEIFEEEDKKLFREIKQAYLDDGIHVILVKGFCDDDKIIDVLAAATQINDNPTINLRTRVLGHTKNLLQRAFSRYFKEMKVTFTSSKPFVLAHKNIDVDKWEQNQFFPISSDISIYYPIQSVIAQGGKRDLEKLKSAISNDHSKLIILVTTNDVEEGYLDFSLLDDFVDQSFVLDSSRKHPETYSIILNNLNKNKIFYE